MPNRTPVIIYVDEDFKDWIGVEKIIRRNKSEIETLREILLEHGVDIEARLEKYREGSRRSDKLDD